jgi:ABC-type Fe3+ transport system permease subunit/DNA-binding beta-propeller fold protein YncE
MNWAFLRNSLASAGGTMVLASVLGSFAALAACGLRRSGRIALNAAALISFVLPPFLVTNTWMYYFGLDGKWRPFINFDIYTLPGSIVILSLLLWPIPFAFISAAVLRLERTYLEQETRLRSGSLIRYLLWPQSRAAFCAAAALVFVLALNNFTVPSLLQTKVYAAEVWLSFNTKFDYGEALKLSWPLIAGPAVLLLLLRFDQPRFSFRTSAFPSQLLRNRLGAIFPSALVLTLVLLAASLLLPGMQLLSSPRTWVEFMPAIDAGKSAAWNSFLFGIVPALLIIVLGTLLSRSRAGLISWLLFLAPGVLLGIALIWIFDRPGLAHFYHGTGIVFLAFTLRYLALGWSGARAAWHATDRSSLEVVTTSGGWRWAQFRLAEWPQGRHLLLAIGYLVYLLCLWEVETLILIVPPGRETLALRVFNMLHYGHASQVDALCVWLLLFALAPLLLLLVSFLAQRLKLRRMAGPAILAIPFLVALGLTGCGSSPAENGQTEFNIDSKLFRAVQIIGTHGTGAGQFSKPRSLALDRDDNLYVVDLTGRVQKFSPDGAYILSWQMPQIDKGKPKGMERDSDGNIVVVEPHYSRVNHFDPTGKLIAQWGVTGTNPGQLFFPRSCAVNSHGELYITEYGLAERIQRFSARGEHFIESFGIPGTQPGQLNRAEGVGFDAEDHLFVANSCNHCVEIFTAEGKHLATFGKAGSGVGEMSYPYDIRIDALGNRFVCEFGNSRVQIFDPHNQPLEILGGPGADPDQMNNPWAIAFNSRGDLYVADALNHRVQKFIRRVPFPPAQTGVHKKPDATNPARPIAAK